MIYYEIIRAVGNAEYRYLGDVLMPATMNSLFITISSVNRPGNESDNLSYLD